MDKKTLYSYEFEKFSLIPNERLLLRGEQRLELKPKEFDLIVCLVQNAGSLVTKSGILSAVWGHDTFVQEGNITTYISNIRKVFGDDPKNPKYIESVPKIGYRFLCDVDCVFSSEPREGVSDSKLLTGPIAGRQTFEVESHKFIPMYLGSECYEELGEIPISENQWASYKEVKTECGRFCFLPFGVGVWHLVERLEFETIADLAIWRRRTYRNIRAGDHLISVLAKELFALEDHSEKHSQFEPVVGMPGYVLSAFVLIEPLWQADSLDTALRLLSCPTPLQSEDSADIKREEAIDLENGLLEAGFQSNDCERFGLDGFDCGYASWAGVSYYPLSKRSESFADRIIEFEIVVQSVWWFANCLKELLLSADRTKASSFGIEIVDLIKQFRRVTHIGATEPTSQRTMHEAILKTSRLEEVVEDTIELYNQLKG